MYRSSFVVVVSGQWCTHCDTRDNRRLSSLLKLRLLVGEILANSEGHYSTPTKSVVKVYF